MGVHLVLTAKKPILPQEWVSSITDEHSDFLKYNAFIAHLPEIKVSEVKAEWRAQIESFIAAAGTNPTHLDSHHHSSYFAADLFRAMLDLAKEYDCPIRDPFTGEISGELEKTRPFAPALIKEFKPRRPDVFLADFYDQQATQDVLNGLLLNLGEGVSELMCHVGYVPDAFMKESIYNKPRQRKLGIRLNPATRQMIERLGIELIDFSNL